jgi:hypothetical protein
MAITLVTVIGSLIITVLYLTRQYLTTIRTLCSERMATTQANPGVAAAILKHSDSMERIQKMGIQPISRLHPSAVVGGRPIIPTDSESAKGSVSLTQNTP